jgi:hypothetical protein
MEEETNETFHSDLSNFMTGAKIHSCAFMALFDCTF